MKMKTSIWRMLCGVICAAAFVSNVHAAGDGIIETKKYNICPGDTITIDAKQTQVFSDTIIRDTIQVAAPTEDSIYVYVVNVYPSFSKTEEREIERGTSFEWRGLTITQAGTYERVYKSVNDCDSIYTLIVTERPGKKEKEVTFTLCDGETVNFNGKTYANAGTYYSDFTADSVYKIIIIKYPSQLYLQTAELDGTHPYYWQYTQDGETKTDTLSEPGIYEHTTHNETTGCNDIWRLVLSRDETSYHFEEALTICENEEFSWRGKSGLNRQGIGTTTHYYDKYRTQHSDQDSIYHLALTVLPVPRVTRTIPFCEQVEWAGKTYTETTVLIDTLSSIQYHCDSIVTTILMKGIAFRHHDTASIVPGETLMWHGLTITHDGLYEDKHTSSFGCDSTYTLGVGLKQAAPVTNTRTYRESVCEGDGFPWRGKTYYNAGTYVDTVFVGSTEQIDSLYILMLTVNKHYHLHERVTFNSFPGYYRGHEFKNEDDEFTFEYKTAAGCDSLVTVVADYEIKHYVDNVTICPGETYIWQWDGQTYRVGGTYLKIEKDIKGNDSVEYVLNLTVNNIPDTYITKTICKGASYTFGDRTLTESGTYTYTFHETGCDSTVHLGLNVLNPDTNIFVHHMDEHDSYVWHGETYTETGVYYHYGTNRYGCDSINILQLTVNHVDTVDSAATVCMNELPFVWHGIHASQTGTFHNAEKQPSGDYVYYRLHLTVRPVVTVDTTFTICDDASVSFNGKTYTEGGHYTDYLTCDTLMSIHINKHPQQVYETNGRLAADHGFSWTYWENGVEKTDVFTNPGTYEFESQNTETGCNDLWRLILTKDETSYHFKEELTICEGDDFSWRGRSDLSRQLGTSHYYDNYTTRAGKDSIYELVLTVNPVERTVSSYTFCDAIEWNGIVYTESAVVYDTVALPTGCYRIERVNLDKSRSFYSYETKDLPQGHVLHWHGIDIGTDGTYYDTHTTVDGCDSTYVITVTIIPAAPETNQYSEELSICAGDTIRWRGKDLWRGGNYVDTVWAPGHETVDSIFTLGLTVWPAPKDTIIRHLYTCGGVGASIRYQGKDYYQDQTIISKLTTVHGCDSIVKVYLHFNTALFLTDTVGIADTELPYTWTYRLSGEKRDTLLTTAGTYNHTEPAEGSCYNREQLTLLVYPTYLFQLDTTVCESQLPFYWLSGPQDHAGDALRHPVGTTKQYEYRYSSVNNTDSIYRLNLTIVPAPKRTEIISICENKDTIINGKSYYDRTKYIPGVVYHDTAYKQNPGNACDSIIYYEISITQLRRVTETRILLQGDTIFWLGDTITAPMSHTYVKDGDIDPATGCNIVYELRVIYEDRKEVTICSIDTAANTLPDRKYPYVWVHPRGGQDTLYTSGIYTDTIFNEKGFIAEYYTLHLTVTQPYDTTIYVHGCEDKGAFWRDQIYWRDTTFIERVEVTPYNPAQPCDSVFHVNIKMDKKYYTYIDTTLCEYQLPLIIGRVNPDTIWQQGNFTHPYDTTQCGCDSLIEGYLTIIPKLTHNDSTFVCEDFFNEGGVITLGDLEHPAFLDNNGGSKWAGKWEGKWVGVPYHDDTIVWDCDHRFFHHIIKRPHQPYPKDTTYYLCEGDSVQLFWPKETWIKTPDIYYDTVPNDNPFYDAVHNTIVHADQAYVCDSVIRWTVKFADALVVDTTEKHIALGDSIWWGGEYRYFDGFYDSICDSQQGLMNSDQVLCKEHHWLHLFADTVRYYLDTIHICHEAKLQYTYTWEDGHELKFNTPEKDTAIFHVRDSLKPIQYNFYDRYYDLVVYYSRVYKTHIFDTICEGTDLRFDEHLRDNTIRQRLLTVEGVYTDTIPAVNGCDSILILHLETRDSIRTTYKSWMVTDRELPYLWSNTWKKEDGTDTTYTDTLRSSGIYRYTMPSLHGCDSTIVLNFTVHNTHVFRDTIDVCEAFDQTLQHTWFTGYVQEFNTPLADDTVFYADTLETRIKYDSIYVLCVNYHQTYETLVRDTICEGEQYRFDLHRGNTTIERWVNTAGTYRDTVQSRYGCDSVIVLKLYVRDRVPVTHKTDFITDRELPYLWSHTWKRTDGTDTTYTDTIRSEGGYRYTMPNIYGCDSIDSLHLTIHYTHLFRDTIEVCSQINKTLQHTWSTGYTQQYTVPLADADIHYYDTLDTRIKLDSIYDLYVHFHEVTVTYLDSAICEGDSIRFGLTKANTPRFLTTNGVYYDTLTRISNGCDSIIELHLNVYPSYRNHETVHIADVDTPYVWEHKQNGVVIGSEKLYATGEYSYVFNTTYGCDSIDSLSLRIHTTYLYKDTVTICQSETPYTWFDRNDIYESGTYTKRFQTHDGYDSTYIRTLIVHPVMYDTIEASICEGDSLRFGLTKANRPRFLYNIGTYHDTLTSVYGCDSILTLYLNVYPKHLTHSTVDIADTQIPYDWKHVQGGVEIDKEKLFAAGEYVYHFTTAYGCDSIDSLSLRVHQTYNIVEDTINICSDATPYSWCDKDNITESGKYIYYGQTFDGYDSIRTVYINVWSVKYDTIHASICEGDSLRFGLSKANRPRFLYNNGDYNDTLTSVHGCDSIVTLHLNVYPKHLTHSTVDVADTQIPYEWKHVQGGTEIESEMLYAAGEYVYHFTTAYGCDSIDSLSLRVHQTYNIVEDTINICSDATPYSWCDKDNITESGKYIYYGQTFDGYDSIRTVYINVWSVKYDTIHASICEGDSLRFGLSKANRPRFLYDAGLYNDTLATLHGCDSIVTLRLNVYPYFRTHSTVDVADTQIPYEWKHVQGGTEIESEMLYAAGEYVYHFTTAFGCDSIDSLSLRVHQTYNIVEDTINICSDATPYSWCDKDNITESGKYIYYGQTFDGYDSIRSVYINVWSVKYDTIHASICEGDSIRFGLSKANRPRFLYDAGLYNDTLATLHGCDSIVTLRLNVYPYFRTHSTVDVADTQIPYEWKHVQGGTEIESEMLYAAGEYVYHFTTAFGCDSIDSLSLRVHQTYNIVEDTINICSDATPYSWCDKDNITESGKYIYYGQTFDGYDSIRSVYINVWSVKYDTIHASICEGDSIRFGLSKANRPRFLYDAGLYNDTLATLHGCDSIVTLRLNVYPYFRTHSTVDVADTQIPYEWKHVQGGTEIESEMLYAAGEYVYHFTTAFGCDSIDSLSLRVHQTYNIVEDTINICSDATPYSWCDKDNITESGKYIYYGQTFDGYDSIRTVYINVWSVKYDTIRASVCEGSSYIFMGAELKKAGIYQDTTTAVNGCDSITTLILTVNQPYFSTLREDILEGQSVTFFDSVCTTSGLYTHYGRTPEGCDSTTVLELVVHPLVDTVVTICSNETPYIWYNRWSQQIEKYYRTGVYRNDTTINGRKYFYGLDLRVAEQAFDTIRHSMCEGGIYQFKGKDYTAAGIYQDTLTGPNGCDSIVTLILTVNKPYYHTMHEDILEGQSVNFFNTEYSQTGIYTHFGVTPEGCDSTTVLELVVHPLVDTVVTVCTTDLPYAWVNKWNGSTTLLYSAGTYRNDTTFVNGVRMFYGLQLITNQPTDTTIYYTICEGTSFSFNGHDLTAAGEYRDTLVNAKGCDSVVIIHLNVEKNYYHKVERTIYEGDTVTFLGEKYWLTGNYPVRYETASGCDSIVELILSVNKLFTDSVSVCATDLPYTWRGKTIYESGIYRDTITNSEGKQTIEGLKVTVLQIARAPEPIVATICEGDFYKFGDLVLSEQGAYYDTLVAVNGCDSIVMLSLQVLPVKYQTERRTIFEGDSVYFFGEWIKEAGIYEHREVNANKCTDTYQLILTVLKQFFIDTTATICRNELPFVWNGYEFNETGDYTMPTSWTDSSRVVTTLHLTVRESFYDERNIKLCSGDVFNFNGREYTEKCEFFDTIPSLVGCDSIIKYVISVHPTYDYTFEKHISDKQPYIFHDRVLTSSGNYEWTGKTTAGCDSIEHLILVVHPSFFQSDTVNICQSDTANLPFEWHGQSISHSGVYSDSMLTSYGFDSVYRLVVYVHPSYFIKEQYELADGSSLFIHGMNISKPDSIYYDTLHTIHGCDSIFQIVVNLKHALEMTTTASICQGDYYDFYGQKLTHSGIYKYTSPTGDLTVTLTLTVNPTSVTEERVVLPDNITWPYIYHGQLYNEPGVYTETYSNKYGCDSVSRLVLVVTSHYSEWYPMPLCEGSELKIDGQVITEAGLYTFLRRSKTTGEMDSLYRVEVYDAPVFEFDMEYTMCNGDTLFFGNNNEYAYTREGHYEVNLKTKEGCDSIYHLDLNVNPSYHYQTQATIRDYETYTWFGQTYKPTKDTICHVNFSTINSCDSTYTLHLNVIHTLRYLTEDTICDGQEYVWRGDTFKTDGYFADTVFMPETFYSAIHTLRLTVMHPTLIKNAKVSEICADDKEFMIEFTYTGAKPAIYSIYFDRLAKDEGFVDVINKPFLGEDGIARAVVPSKAEVVYLDHTAYVRPNNYSMRLVLDNGVCGMSRSDSLVLLIKYPSWILEQNWDDVVAPLRKEKNGGYEFAQTEWYINGILQPNNGLGYLQSDKLKEGDEVVMLATRNGENYAIPTCPLIIQSMEPNVYDNPILTVYPSMAPHRAPRITMEATQTGQYSIYSSAGTQIATGEFEEGKQQITLPTTCGIYFIRAVNGEKVETHKVVLY